MSGFKLNFDSKFDILYAIFCFNFSLYWYCSWHTKKKKSNDQDLTKYLINNRSSFWIMRVSLWSTNCVVPCAECTLPPPPSSKKVYSAPRPSLWSTNCVVPCAECTLPPPPSSKKVYSAPRPPPPPIIKKGQRVACTSAETVQCLRS